MRKWAWWIFVATSAVLLAGTVVIWVRAQWAAESVVIDWVDGPRGAPVSRSIMLQSFRGSGVFYWDRTNVWFNGNERVDEFDAVRATLPAVVTREAVAAPFEVDFAYLGSGWSGGAFAGFGWEHVPHVPGATNRFVTRVRDRRFAVSDVGIFRLAAPWWFLALLFALAPARAAWTLRKRGRRLPHQCRGCGYDLRATADEAGPRLARCPECGRASS